MVQYPEFSTSDNFLSESDTKDSDEFLSDPME